MRRLTAAALALALAACSGKPPFRFPSDLDRDLKFRYDIDLSTFGLKNGLRVVLAPSRDTNVVVVDVRYQVGSSAEPRGKTGLAHFVEHLDFLERAAPGQPTLEERLGQVALGHNAETGLDTTDYYAVAPRERADELLDIEATRMGATCGAIDPTLMERERAVVAAELLWRGSATLEPIARAVFGEGSPYGHTPGGTDLAALGLGDVCQFIDAHYSPDQAVLVVSGAFDREDMTRAITVHFGRLARRGKPFAPRPDQLAPLDTEGPMTVEADVAKPHVMLAYGWIPWADKDARAAAMSTLLADLLLDELVAHDDDLDAARVLPWGGKWGGAVLIDVTPHATADVDAVAAKVKKALASLDQNPALLGRLLDAELRDWRALAYQDPVETYENLLARGPLLADYMQFTSYRDFHLHDLQDIHDLTGQQVVDAYEGLIARARPLELRVVPAKGGARTIDLAHVRVPSDLPASQLHVDPAEADAPLQVQGAAQVAAADEVTLDNGLRVVFVPRAGSAMFQARMIFPTGSSDDPPRQPGAAQAAADYLKIDYARTFDRDELQLLVASDAVGTYTWHQVDADHTVFAAEGIASWARWHLWKLHLELESGVYDAAALEAAPTPDAPDRAERLVREKLYGASHPYAQGGAPIVPDADSLDEFKRAHYVTVGATLVLAGNFDRAQLERDVRELFGAWPRRAPSGVRHPPAAATTAAVLVRDDAKRGQLHVALIWGAASTAETRTAARAVARRMIDARLSALREELAATYGVDVSYESTAAGDFLTVTTDVDASRAAEVLTRLEAELTRLREHADELREDFVRARRDAVGAALAETGTTAAAVSEIDTLVELGLPLDTFARLPAQIGAVTPADVAALLHGDLDPARRVVLLVGPGARAAAEAAKLGPISELAPRPAAKPKAKKPAGP